ncbi:uncharacterized protein K460DRAFT_405464 [Cucurbitaria berberidis CBS 394.84]|uniref:Uncharacterized protein n=1 Tax=Cucurbitaria berberidis CBS 394.84 TaxID=1168544 RepID=A0A9P4L8F2_9PLEO|nr:uncharacterized protein K460DRAFT_405464 [Cucurbitaria berberidis CBS 394.84]KAF1845198.1 hypothetical protein K460DRAFT_405464 [Cucurbitaria berberidis CBS 394.84]
MATIALEVFGLLVGGVLGIVDLFLPAASPLHLSALEEGHSLLRIGIGLNASSGESLGGTIPSINVFNEEKSHIGYAGGSPYTHVENGTFITVTVLHDSGHTFQQPTYVEVAGGPDAVCIAYIAQTWADGTQLGWLGDVGKFCGAKWYYSNTYISTKNGSMHKPYCTWIGGQRPRSCSDTRKRQDDSPTYPQNCTSDAQDSMYTYSGFKVHTPDFGPVGSRNDFTVPENPKELCNFPKLEWYKTQRFQTSPASNLRPLPMKSLLFTALSILSSTVTHVAAATMKERSTWPGRDNDEGEHVSVRESIVGSHDRQHSSKALCASPNSWGPDFVSFGEGLFCDMTLKRTWPLCNGNAGLFQDCYNWSSHTIVGGKWKKKRAIRYSRVLEWR